jgi:HEAT repeat protein
MNTINALIEELKNDDCDVRWHVARALRWTKDARAIDALMRAFKDVDCNVRWSAAEALGAISDEQAVEPLVRLLNNQREETIIRQRAREPQKCGSGSRAIMR